MKIIIIKSNYKYELVLTTIKEVCGVLNALSGSFITIGSRSLKGDKYTIFYNRSNTEIVVRKNIIKAMVNRNILYEEDGHNFRLCKKEYFTIC